MSKDQHFDIIIIGGGLVGLFLAYSLNKEDLKIAIVERHQLNTTNLSATDYQTRVSAISPGCKTLLEQLQLWPAIAATQRVSPYERMVVWDSLGRGQIHFDCTTIAQPCLGYIIENAVIHNALVAAVTACRNITLISGDIPKEIVYLNDEQIGLKFEDKRLSTKLLVGADGGNSWVRQFAKIKTTSWPYHHEALVTNVRTEHPHQKTAWQCFLPEGPLALLPLPDPHLCSIVWSAIPQEIRRLEQMSNDKFNLEITNAFEGRLGKITRISTHVTVPLVMTHANEYIKSRIALVGDAAHAIHPLAGQGVNLGFMDAAKLAQVITQSLQQKRDFGQYLQLRDYERQRKSENWVMVIAMDALKRLFQSESPFLVSARSMGLKVTDHIDFLKNQFIYHAAGLK